jgi:hypothetical protein
VDVTSALDAPHPRAKVFAAVDDLTNYPAWLNLVARAQPTAGVEGEEGPAWIVELRARIGPFARSKRLRMYRSIMDAPGSVVFERRETDGKQHSPWVLRVSLEPQGRSSTRLTMALHYGGTMFDGVVERVLQREIEHAKPRLLEFLAGTAR